MQLKRKKEDVSLANIEKELVNLWESYDATGKVRACLFTLVVYCENESRLDYLQELVRMVIERFPCRIIFVHGRIADDNHTLKSTVSTETSRKGETTIACDRISITAGGKHLERIPYLILPHLVPDLPIYLLWGQDPTANCNVLPHLERFCDRFIFDSDFTDDLNRFATQLLTRLSSNSRTTIDVTWARLRAWRDVVAQTFNSPENLAELRASKEIVITYHDLHNNDCTHAHFAAVYFQAWLAARLLWKPVSMTCVKGEHVISYTNTFQGCRVILKPLPADKLPPGVLIGLEFLSHNGANTSIKRLGSSRMVHISLTSKKHCEIPTTIALSSLDRNSMLMNEIFYKGPNDHYRSMMQMLTQLQLSQ